MVLFQPPVGEWWHGKKGKMSPLSGHQGLGAEIRPTVLPWKDGACRYDWRPRRLPRRLSRRQWRRLLRWFLLGLSAARVAEENGVGRESAAGGLRALLLVRQAMVRDVPSVFIWRGRYRRDLSERGMEEQTQGRPGPGHPPEAEVAAGPPSRPSLASCAGVGWCGLRW
jgi:hypothetical protein